MKDWVDLAIIVNGIGTIAALIVTITIYCLGIKKERKIDTIKTFSAIRRRFGQVNKASSDIEKKSYVKELEFFAIGIKERIYDIGVITKMSGSLLCSQNNIWLQSYIIEKQLLHNNSQTYKNVEIMLSRIAKRISYTTINYDNDGKLGGW